MQLILIIAYMKKINNINENTNIKDKMEDMLDLYINISENNGKTKVDIDDKEENGVLSGNQDEIINKKILIYNCEKDKK